MNLKSLMLKKLYFYHINHILKPSFYCEYIKILVTLLHKEFQLLNKCLIKLKRNENNVM